MAQKGLILKKHNLPQIIFYAINPFISLLYSFALMTKKEKDCSFYFAISLATIIVYFPIMFDTSSNFFVYYFDIDRSLFSIYTIAPTYMKRYLGVDYYYFIILSLIVIFYTWLKITKSSFYKTNYKKSWLYWIVITIFSFTYRDVMDLNRNILSFSVAFFYILYLERERGKSNLLMTLLFIFLSLSIHMSSLIIWIAYLAAKKIRFKRQVWYIVVILSLVIGFALPQFIGLFSGLIQSIGGPLGARINEYLYGDTFGVQSYSGIGQILKKALNVCLIFSTSLYACYSMKNVDNKSLHITFIILAAFGLFFLQFVTFFERINLAICFMFGFILIESNKAILFKNCIILMIVFRSIYLNFFFYFPLIFFHYESVLKKEAPSLYLATKPFYMPTFYLLNMDNGYSDEYLIKYDVWR